MVEKKLIRDILINLELPARQIREELERGKKGKSYSPDMVNTMKTALDDSRHVADLMGRYIAIAEEFQRAKS